ncbi:nucleotide-binding protein [Azoarcus sp. L1K30]|uniref:TIR domain-containing protein n=1 Tax=Azoarcus sp. L1K30 TaxID=2820277 RepID=UPI001B83281B|nr:TIR domain-containing protein [Azoarcus sp. L1K30]MBR0568009.1 nucleotide-binding protein [Azoarcus sp. L1K30]
MKSDLLSVLQEVKEGRINFEPVSNNEEDREKFQAVGKILDFANKQGLIDGLHIRKESTSGRLRYDFAIISNGLTYQGEQLLVTEKAKALNNGDDTKGPGTNSVSRMDALHKVVSRGRKLLDAHESRIGVLQLWIGSVRVEIGRICGLDSNSYLSWPAPSDVRGDRATRLFETHVLAAERFYSALQEAQKTLYGPGGHKIFIGHGRSPMWLLLNKFLTGDLHLSCVEFNSTPTAGISTNDRLYEMLDTSTFAFLVMTAEDQQADNTFVARANVIHEAGLFQGRLGTRRAIILIEDGCSAFSNIDGLTTIRFPKDSISAVFYEVQRVLVREGIINSH